MKKQKLKLKNKYKYETETFFQNLNNTESLYVWLICFMLFICCWLLIPNAFS